MEIFGSLDNLITCMCIKVLKRQWLPPCRTQLDPFILQLTAYHYSITTHNRTADNNSDNLLMISRSLITEGVFQMGQPLLKHLIGSCLKLMHHSKIAWFTMIKKLYPFTISVNIGFLLNCSSIFLNLTP